MAGAAGGFVTRAFEAMLKECTANRGKFAALQQSIQSYLGACPCPCPILLLLFLFAAGHWVGGSPCRDAVALGLVGG
jgi:ABC-type nickel/cobalt efflux system permease component RcnA